MSHPRYTLPDTAITSGSAVDRAVRGIKSFEVAPWEGLAGRVSNPGGGGGGGPAGRGLAWRFSWRLPMQDTRSMLMKTVMGWTTMPLPGFSLPNYQAVCPLSGTLLVE